MTSLTAAARPAPGAGLESLFMQRNRHLLVALARSAADVGLIRYAAMIARLGTVAETRFVHVLPTDPAAAHDHDATLKQIQNEVHALFTDVPDNVQVFCDVLKGPLLDRLLAFAAEQEDDVMMVGHRRDQSGRRALARRLAMKAPCSVWMIPDDSPPAITRILVPIDFSEHAADTLQVATSLAKLLGQTECLALHVYFDTARVTYEDNTQVLRGRETEHFQSFMAPLQTHGVTVRPIFEEGANVSHVIQRVAAREKADLIIMATRGRSPSAAILLGSVAEDAIIDTTVPLLVVKHFGARMSVLQALLDRGFRTRKTVQFD